MKIMARIKDIAKLANVSPSTVSNVIHGRKNKLSPELYEKVQRILEEEHYVTHRGAQMLTKQGSRLIALILTYSRAEEESIVQDPFVSSIIGAVQSALQKEGYFLLLYANPHMELCTKITLEWNVEGIILLGAKREDYYYLRSLNSVPVVTIDTIFFPEDHSYVNVGLEDYRGALEMTRYLLSKGHEKIAFLSLMDGMDVLREDAIDNIRYQGYLQAYEEKNLAADRSLCRNLSYDGKTRQKQYKDFYREKFWDCTALFFTADIMALEMMSFCMDQKLRIPEDISIAGYDGIFAAKRARPRLCTICQDGTEKGRRAVMELLLLLKEERDIGTRKKDIRLPVFLEKGSSVQAVGEQKQSPGLQLHLQKEAELKDREKFLEEV